MIDYDSAFVNCPYCGETIELLLDPESAGTWVEDCEVCCQPWQVKVGRDAEGELTLSVERSD